MEDLQYHSDDCICALATPWGKGAIAVIRTSGTGCLENLENVFSGREALAKAEGNTVLYGHITDRKNNITIDEVMLAVYRAPRSYTGQDAAEIMCHGSLPGVRGILDLLRRNGFRDAGPGEFTMRSFLNGKMDLTRAEAVNELIGAKTAASHRLAFNRLNGNICRRIDEIKSELVDVTARIELLLDYPEDEVDFDDTVDVSAIDAAKMKLDALISTYNTGKLYRDGVTVALAGPTNAGKSSLFNLFVKEDRALVSETHGTTRDYITELLTIRGIPVTLVDTAGLRESDDKVESQGIARSKELISGSDIVLFVWDSSVAFDGGAFDDIMSRANAVIGVWNKCDMPGLGCPEGFVRVSAVEGTGFEDLEKRILECIHADTEAAEGGAVIDSDRQKILLEEASEGLGRLSEGIAAGCSLDAAAVDLQDSLRAMGEITGEVSTADILDKMFSSFCVGK